MSQFTKDVHKSDKRDAEHTRGGVTFVPRIDIVETEHELVLYADLPGVVPADLDVRYEDGELTLLGKVAARTPPVLIRAFPQGLPKVDGKKLGRLRASYEEWSNAQEVKSAEAGALHTTWVQLVLGELLEFDDQTLRSGDGLPSGLDVPLAEHHETLRPSRAIVEPSGRAKAGTPRLLVAVWPSDQDLESVVPAARWAASPLERITQQCRSAGVRLGLVTNGERWTFVDAHVGQTAGYASWYAGL